MPSLVGSEMCIRDSDVKGSGARAGGPGALKEEALQLHPPTVLKCRSQNTEKTPYIYGSNPVGWTNPPAPVKNLIAASESGHTGEQINSFDAVTRMQETPPHKRFLVGWSSAFMHATRRTPHVASRLVLAMSAWSVETRRDPSQHCRDVRVHGRTTTVTSMASVHPMV